MRRRSQPSSESLELLLDTICNTFGGVVFIAILVIVMLQLSGKRPTSQAAAIAEELVRQQQLTTALANLTEERSRLQNAARAQEATLQQMAPAQLQSLVAERTREAARRASLNAERELLSEELRDEQSARVALADTVKELLATLAKSQAAVDDLQAQLENERKKRRMELRTSVLRSPGLKREVVAVLQYDRFYLWHFYGAIGERLGVNTDDFVVLSSNVLEAETTPNPAAGIPLNEQPQTADAIRRRLDQFSPQKVYLSVVVRPDSFDSFKFLRDVFVSLGFEYRLLPAKEGAAFVDRGGMGGKVQ